VQGKDYILHLAGQNDRPYVKSQTDPSPDLHAHINILGTAVLLEVCKHHNPDVLRLIYIGTRGEYGPSHPAVRGQGDTHKSQGDLRTLQRLTAQKPFKGYHDNYGLRSITLYV